MDILITGAAGFIGRNLTATLYNIRDGKDRRFPELMPGGPLQIGEIFACTRETTDDELAEYCSRADFVFDLAGTNRPADPKDPAQYADGNQDYAIKLLGILKACGNTCPVMLSSSAQATLEGRFAGSVYGESKRETEELFFAYGRGTGARTLVYRFPNVFGKWCRPNYNSAIATFCHNTANGLPITVNDPSVAMDVVYIDDICEELVRALLGKETYAGQADSARGGTCAAVGTDAAERRFCEVPVHYKTTLGHLADTIQSFGPSRRAFFVPDLSDELTSKLYSTWLSYLPPEGFIYDLKMNSDARGSFTELVKTLGSGQFSVNVSKPGITKGQHWHHSKTEKFIVVSGEALIQLRKIDPLAESAGKASGTEAGRAAAGGDVIEFRVSGERPQVVDMIPGYTHNIINLSDTDDLVTLMWASEVFNPDRPDTFSETV